MSRFAPKRNQSQTDAVTVGHETRRWPGTRWTFIRDSDQRPTRRPYLDIGGSDQGMRSVRSMPPKPHPPESSCLSAVSRAAADATSKNLKSGDVGPVISRT